MKFDETHDEIRETVREFVEKELNFRVHRRLSCLEVGITNVTPELARGSR